MKRSLSPILVSALALTVLLAPPARPAGAARGFVENAIAPPYKVVTRHAAVVNGKKIAYDAIVEERVFDDETKKARASLVTISYIRTDVAEGTVRPVVFAFNGGPGSASLWTNFGGLGPRRILFQDPRSDEDVHPKTVPPFLYGENAESLLDAADLVFIDPPGTGFSRVLDGNDETRFYGVDQDARLVCAWIEDWIARNGRWNSPRYLLGESYGTIRAAEVAFLLAGGPMSTGRLSALTLNGVILLGQAMNLNLGNVDVECVNALPNFAATAWYHGKVERGNRTLEEHVDDARAFAAGEYLQALHAGSALPAGERSRVAGRLSGLIGLSPDVLLECDLRPSAALFASALLRKEGLRAGAYDSRFTLPQNPDGGDPVADDPAMAQYTPSIIAAFREHLAKDLGVTLKQSYEAIAFQAVNSRWDYGFGPGIPVPPKNFAKDLAAAMGRNPALRLFVGIGYYDLVTTLGSAEYTIAHAGIDPGRVSFGYYPSGHMAYIGAESRKSLAVDLRRFIARAAGEGGK